MKFSLVLIATTAISIGCLNKAIASKISNKNEQLHLRKLIKDLEYQRQKNNYKRNLLFGFGKSDDSDSKTVKKLLADKTEEEISEIFKVANVKKPKDLDSISSDDIPAIKKAYETVKNDKSNEPEEKELNDDEVNTDHKKLSNMDQTEMKQLKDAKIDAILDEVPEDLGKGKEHNMKRDTGKNMEEDLEEDLEDDMEGDMIDETINKTNNKS